jgi:alkylhydroperoxidase/carboxymuconolactone decarboxylase family protein YurZ
VRVITADSLLRHSSAQVWGENAMHERLRALIAIAIGLAATVELWLFGLMVVGAFNFP